MVDSQRDQRGKNSWVRWGVPFPAPRRRGGSKNTRMRAWGKHNDTLNDEVTPQNQNTKKKKKPQKPKKKKKKKPKTPHHKKKKKQELKENNKTTKTSSSQTFNLSEKRAVHHPYSFLSIDLNLTNSLGGGLLEARGGHKQRTDKRPTRSRFLEEK